MFRFLTVSILAVPLASAAIEEISDSIDTPTELEGIVVTSRSTIKKLNSATNTTVITSGELKRAACCNLGESFTTNPSVDVSYSDAATGARQIKLLGLSGSYVQMLTENIPAGRGVATPYALGYIAGPWMQSIQVSKGASSVKNGYESVTGQINVELKKPQNDPQLNVNMYYDSMNKLEVNFDGNLHFGKNWSGGLLVHAENAFSTHDGNDDGFADMPKTRQISVMNRWIRLGTDYVFQGAAKFLGEWRRGGQIGHHATTHTPYLLNIDGRRAELFTKNAYIYDHDNDGNVALILSGSYHDQNQRYGKRICDISQWEGYASLMYERRWGDLHALSTGLSTNIDRFDYTTLLNPVISTSILNYNRTDASAGAYGQYTLNIGDRLVAMAGMRVDRHNRYGWLLTPRMHVRWNPSDIFSLHGSAGRGHRAPHPLAEYSYLMASARELIIDRNLDMESAWNAGGGINLSFSPGGRRLDFSAEYYYTYFTKQLIVDLDSDPHKAIIYSSGRTSFSHALQIEVTTSPINDVSLTAAWRFTDVKYDLGNGLVNKPLISRHKGLITVSYTPDMGLWQADVTLAINGSGRFPTPYKTVSGDLSWPQRFNTFTQLSAQLTRNFRHWSIYIGGENLTNFRQKNPVIGAEDPWGTNFDATMVYGPLQGAMFYVGFRYNFTKYL
ncbi:MAG: TonB-dependent receptor [Odoribacter sp.]|nr:TonB-dependent receptor [Odoribacter sp.]